MNMYNLGKNRVDDYKLYTTQSIDICIYIHIYSIMISFLYGFNNILYPTYALGKWS